MFRWKKPIADENGAIDDKYSQFCKVKAVIIGNIKSDTEKGALVLADVPLLDGLASYRTQKCMQVAVANEIARLHVEGNEYVRTDGNMVYVGDIVVYYGMHPQFDAERIDNCIRRLIKSIEGGADE